MQPFPLVQIRLLSLFCLGLPAFLWAVPSAFAQPRDEAGEELMFQRINTLRTAARLPSLERDDRLDAAARTHSADMAWHDDLTHVSERTGDPATRVNAAGFAAASVGENITKSGSANDAHQSLVASEPHLANMLSPAFTHVGLAVVRDTGRDAGEVWVTQVFAAAGGSATSPESGSDASTVESGASPTAPQPAIPTPYQQQTRSQLSVPSVGLAEPSVPNQPRHARVAQQAQELHDNRGPAPTASPVVTVPGPGTNGEAAVAGYWVFHGRRWYYYPLPPNAVAGQVLQPDLSVTGGPPGYEGGTPWADPAPAAPQVDQRPAPAFGWSPRRHYQRWRNAR